MPVLETLALTAAVASLRRGAHRAVVPRAMIGSMGAAARAKVKAVNTLMQKLNAAAKDRVVPKLSKMTTKEVEALNGDAVNALFTKTAGGQETVGVAMKKALSHAKVADRAKALATVFKTNGTQQPASELFNTYAKLAKHDALPKAKASSAATSGAKNGTANGSKSADSATRGGSKSSNSNNGTTSKSNTNTGSWGTTAKSTKPTLSRYEQSRWKSTLKSVSSKVKKTLEKLPVAVQKSLMGASVMPKALDTLLKSKAAMYRTLAKQRNAAKRAKMLSSKKLKPTSWYEKAYVTLRDACKSAGVKITSKGVTPA